MDEEKKKKKVEEIVSYLLILDRKKIPVKKSGVYKFHIPEWQLVDCFVFVDDIRRLVWKAVNINFLDIMKEVSERLSYVFGLQLVELQGKLKGQFILVNKLTPVNVIWTEVESCKTALLTVILAVIFINGNVIVDGDLWIALKKFGIDPTVPHPVFKDVKKLVVNEFCQQQYLEFIKLPRSDQTEFEVRWGQRAFLETSKADILKFVCQVFKTDPKQWTIQYRDAYSDQQQDG